MDWWYNLLAAFLPFEWTQYEFMGNALLAVILITPVFGIMGAMVINNRMAFFSDVMGHSALTGVAIGALLGLLDPMPAMLLFAAALALLINLFRGATKAAPDTVLGVFFAATVALGVVILSRNGGFNRFTSFLIGDILAVTPEQILTLAIMLIMVLLFWVSLGNSLLLTSLNSSLAKSRRINVFLLDTAFACLVAIVVTLAIRWVGILIINSLLILPAAAARNLAKNMRSYILWSVAISLVSGITGLIVSYYWNTASGATIVLVSAVFYIPAAILGKTLRNRA